MAERLSLNGDGWKFAGFHGEEWRWREAYKPVSSAKGWMPCSVPGSVHWDLLKVGEIPDPYFERNSRLVEWVHQRQWVYKRDFALPAGWAGRRVFLKFDGVDYTAEFYLDGQLLGTHESPFRPAIFEVTDKVKPGESHHLAVALKDAPPEAPQLGRSSQVETTKPRFGYWWDFATRLVHLGIWQDVTLFATGPVRLTDVWVRPTTTGVTVQCTTDKEAETHISIYDPDGRLVAEGQGPDYTCRLDKPQLWWANGQGDQPLYRCRVTVAGAEDSDSREVTFGIRQIALQPNPAAPADALPYTFTVNGRPLFVTGYNWVPVDHMYGRPDLKERYQQLIALAKASGVNLIRVWGGGLLERELFYDLCDRAGILVWQEFWQSSSGIDNVPNNDPEYLAKLDEEARGAVPLRRNHACLAVWCGGNELTDWAKNPATTKEPALAMLQEVVAELDPDRAYLPTSPSGPMFGTPDFPTPEQADRQHDVHGPWHYRGPVDSYLPYNHSNALFHSEFGTQGTVAKASLDRFMDSARQWPPDETNPLWVHHGAWWPQRHRVRELFGEGDMTIDEYLMLSQYLQAENLRYGVESNRRRAPRCSGTIIWQLNEPWPNSHCTTVVDYYLRPKMAYYYVKKAYAPVAASLRYEGPIMADGILKATPFLVADEPFAGTVRITLSGVDGTLHHEQTGLEPLHFPMPADVIICTLALIDEKGATITENPYLFSKAAPPIFETLRHLPMIDLQARQEGDRLILANPGPGFAFFPAVDLDDPRFYFRLDDNCPLLAPGQSAALTLTLTEREQKADPDFPHGRPAPAGGPLTVTVRGWNTRPLTLTWEG